MDDSARRAAAYTALRELTTDLRQWVEWAGELGAEDFPREVVTPPTRGPAQAPAARPAAAATAPPSPGPSSPPPSTPHRQPAPRQMSKAATSDALTAVRTDLGHCTRCGLHQGRTHLVFGVGHAQADLMLIGEAPGRNEDRLGEPFVGRAGQLLTRMLHAIGIPRDEAYIANVIKCRPPNNRDPEPAEVAACSPFLHGQIQAVAPRVIMTLGRFAGQNVLGVDESMGRMRGAVGSFQDIPVVPTYHPAYLLRNPAMKRQAWEDLKKVQELLRT